MNNEDIVTILTTIADLLEIRGDNFFKIRAYRMAAETIIDSSEDIASLATSQSLENLPGIGPAIAKKITEYVTTGSLPFYENLKKEIPLELLELLKIPGLGPRKIATVYKELGITTIQALKSAAEKGKLQQLEGFGEITEKNILRGIRFQQQTQGRVLLMQADTTANHYVEYLKQEKSIDAMSIAGSLRRMKETIGDIDILVSSDKPENVMNHFISYSLVDHVLLQGKTKTSVRLTNNIQVDLRVVEQKSYGAALQYFTGSREHNVALRGKALKKGFKLSEYGLYQKNTNKYLVGETEEEIYQQIGLDYIPPELRENRGEMQAAAKHSLPRLLRLNDIQGDLHIHSTWSDGMHTIPEIIKNVESMNYQYIGITDHSQSLRVANGLQPDQVRQKIEEIKKFNEKTNLTVFCGTECDIKKDGSLDYPDEILSLFDYVIVGIHMGFSMTPNQATERILMAMEHPAVTFVAHPTCRMIGHRESLPIDMNKLFKKAVETDTFLEINSFPDRLDLSDIHVKQAKDHGCRFVINTDAHAPPHLNYIKYGVATARRGWLERKDVINTASSSEIKKILSS